MVNKLKFHLSPVYSFLYRPINDLIKFYTHTHCVVWAYNGSCKIRAKQKNKFQSKFNDTMNERRFLLCTKFTETYFIFEMKRLFVSFLFHFYESIHSFCQFSYYQFSISFYGLSISFIQKKKHFMQCRHCKFTPINREKKEQQVIVCY